MEPVRLPRPEYETVAAAPIVVVLGGRERRLPLLSIRANRAWKEGLAATVGSAWLAYADASDYGAITAVVSGLSDAMLDLLLSYDVTGALGGREWLEENATDAEVYAAMKEVLAVAYPPFQDARTLPGLGQALVGLITSVSQARTSSSPPSGVPSPAAWTRS